MTLIINRSSTLGKSTVRDLVQAVTSLATSFESLIDCRWSKGMSMMDDDSLQDSRRGVPGDI